MKKIFLVLALLFSTAVIAQTFSPLDNNTITITAAGATDRTQGPDQAVSYCTFQADDGNTGPVYIGGYQVTNSSGTREGLKINIGGSISNIKIPNLNWVYFAADNANDVVRWLCI